MFRETEGPVVVLFVAIIVVLLYNYIDSYIETNRKLNETIDNQQLIIQKKIEENKQLSELVSYMYYRQTGKQIPNTWTPIPNGSLKPTH